MMSPQVKFHLSLNYQIALLPLLPNSSPHLSHLISLTVPLNHLTHLHPLFQTYSSFSMFLPSPPLFLVHFQPFQITPLQLLLISQNLLLQVAFYSLVSYQEELELRPLNLSYHLQISSTIHKQLKLL